MVMGILAITCGMCCCYGMPFNLLGIVFSLVALAQIRNDPQSQAGPAAWPSRAWCSPCLSLAMAVLFFAFGLALSTPDILRKMQRL